MCTRGFTLPHSMQSAGCDAKDFPEDHLGFIQCPFRLVCEPPDSL